ncbi:MAG: hypothetical protein QOI24_4442 [Acidobacteriota bacterium]|nr:hypothetical protein [Acidobacteriota bacterium]
MMTTMNPRIAAVIAVTSLAAVVIVVAVSASPDTKALDSRIGTTPVVVELFTSQGCSSCPAADALLRTFVRDSRLRGKVIPLAFHVDYWDRLGWRDPFSSRVATQRQMAYIRTLRVNSAYTPQIVINGSREMVGSNESAIESAIEAASKQPSAGTLRLTTARKDNAIDVTLRGDVAREGNDVIVALYEDDVMTEVGSGENGGRKLVNDAVVRQFVRIDAARGALEKMVTFRADPAWQAGKLGVAAFLQDKTTLKIGAAATSP